MRKNKLLLLLALLLTAATGAWAQTETKLVTINSTGGNASFTSGSKTFKNIATVTFSGEVYNEGDEAGWYAFLARTLTVTAAEGYTITSCKFYTYEGTAMTGYTIEGESPSVYLTGGTVYTDASTSVFVGQPGISKIEVYGYAGTPEPAGPTTYKVTMKDGVKDADKWTVKVGEGEAQALPLEGVTEGQTVTVTYTGNRHVKGVKAEKKAAGPVTYTELKGGEVLHVGDILSDANVEYYSDDSNLLPHNCPFTVIRANITGDEEDPIVTPAPDGAYYVIQDKDGDYYFIFKKLPVTATSDGILITITGGGANYRNCNVSVHEP
jgi:hypothetical protein